MFSKFNLNSNQNYALVVLILSIIYLILGFNIQDSFLSGPVGPNHWVIGIACCLIILALFLFFQKIDYHGNFPKIKSWQQRLPFIVAIIAYAKLLPFLGFIISTPILMTIISLWFKARLPLAIISAVTMTLVCYLLFNVGLEISLPKGLWFR